MDSQESQQPPIPQPQPRLGQAMDQAPAKSDLQRWIDGDRTVDEKLFRWVGGIWHNRLRKIVDMPMTLGTVIFGLFRILSFFAMTLSPIWLKLILQGSGKAESFSWPLAVGAAIALVAFQGYNWIFDRVTKSRKDKGDRREILQDLSFELARTIAQDFHQFVIAEIPAALQGVADTATISILRLMRRVVQLHTGKHADVDFEVMLWLFNDTPPTSVRIANRARALPTPRRPAGQVLAGEEVMAFSAAVNPKKHRTVDDFKKKHPCGYEGPPDNEAHYRSILFIPLLDATTPPGYSIGTVSIDSVRQYRFWPDKDVEELITKLGPYCCWLKLLLRQHPHRYNLP